MDSIRTYFDAHKALRNSVLCILFCVACATLFMVFTVWVFVGLPGTASDRFQKCGFPVCCSRDCPSLRLRDCMDTERAGPALLVHFSIGFRCCFPRDAPGFFRDNERKLVGSHERTIPIWACIHPPLSVSATPSSQTTRSGPYFTLRRLLSNAGQPMQVNSQLRIFGKPSPTSALWRELKTTVLFIDESQKNMSKKLKRSRIAFDQYSVSIQFSNC